jgi:hypothetical protein
MSIALPQAAVAHAAPVAGNRRLRLLFAVILITSLSALALSVVSAAKPIGSGDDLPGYAAIAPDRDYVWTFFILAAVQLIVGACAIALAAWLLTPARGSRWADVGGGLVWIGAALYGVGVGGWAALYYFGSDPATLDPALATRLIDHANDDAARMLAVPFGGAALIALGGLILSLALWRAGTVPRWLPILGALSGIATLLARPDTVAGIVFEAASAATSIAVGWYAWKRAPAASPA